MIQNQFMIHDQKNKPLKLRAERAAFYVRGQIVEAVSEEQDLYYLFYYQNEFLTAKKAVKLRRNSYIESAFKDGITFQAPHPFIDALITSNQTSKIINNKQLLRKLNQQYTKHEKAYILTFFESFISKKQLFEEIKSMFYEYRRNGKLFSAYQIIRILKDFAPNHSLVKSLSSDLIYKDFAKMYYDRSEDLFVKDPIEAEKIMFSDREHYSEKYVLCLQKEARSLELNVSLYNQLIHNPTYEAFELFQDLLHTHFSDYEVIAILEHLSEQVSLTPIQEKLFKLYLSTNQVNKVSHLMNNYNFYLSDEELNQISRILENTDPNQLNVEPNQLQTLLGKVTNSNHTLAEKLLHKYVGAMLRKYDLFFIKKWLEPFRKQHGNLEVIEKFNRMYELSEDLDHMQSLGELYYEFKYWNQALECFSLESELKPEEAKPLKWLSKTYREMGMKEESDAYQKMFVSLQKQA